MVRLVIGVHAALAFLVIIASATLMERTLVILCGLLACAVTVAMTCALFGLARRKQQRIWPVLAGALASLALIISIVASHWPLRAAYHLSRPSLERAAEHVRAGHRLVTPARIGFFNVVEAEVNRHGVVCLWVDPNPSGKTGLVQCGPEHVPFNLWSMVSLDNRWQFIAED